MKILNKLIFAILLSITFFGCKKESIDQSQFDIDSSNLFLICNINDYSIELDSDATITGGGGRLFPVDSLDSVLVDYRSGIAEHKHPTNDINSFEIIFYENLHPSLLNLNEITPDSIFRSFFSIGQKTFIQNNSFEQNHDAGVLITWTDNQSVSWATAKNVHNITGNEINISDERYFEITHSIYQDPHSQIKVDLHKIRATFNCVLYNIDGDSIILSNGEFVGVFSNRNE